MPPSTDDDHGAELMRIAQMAAGAFMAAHPGAWLSYEDVVGDAAVAAVGAAQRYDEAAGASLATYTYRRATGAIIDGIRDRSLVSRSEYQRGVRLADLPANRQAPGSWEQLAEDTPLHPVDRTDGPETVAERAEEVRQLHIAVAHLPEQCRIVVTRSLLEEATLATIAKELGLTLARVCQIRKRGLALLRAALSMAWYDRSFPLSGGVRAQNEERAYLRRMEEAGVVAA